MVRAAGKWKTNRNLTKMAFNIKTTQDMHGLTCWDLSLLSTGTSQLLELNLFQLMFNRFGAVHACNTHLSWMNNTGPPTEHGGSLFWHKWMPKHPFMLTTKKPRFFMYFDGFWQARLFPALVLYKLDNATQHSHRAKECFDFLCLVYVTLLYHEFVLHVNLLYCWPL